LVCDDPALQENMQGYEYVKGSVEKVRDRIEEACRRAGRRGDEVSLLGVTKNRTAEEVMAVMEAGVKMIGENRVQEAESKRPHISGEFEFHLIGHLQTNKAAKAAALFDVVQSVDSFRLAERLSDESRKIGRTLRVYLQVNTSDEGSKSGYAPEEFLEEAERIFELPGLDVRGVMTIGPLTDDEEEMRQAFVHTREFFEKLRDKHSGVSVLSMGMSDDLEFAVEEGSTQLRIGRALFERG
jgi:PLP dependent protein